MTHTKMIKKKERRMIRHIQMSMSPQKKRGGTKDCGYPVRLVLGKVVALHALA